MEPREERLVLERILHESIGFLFEGEIDADADGAIAFRRVRRLALPTSDKNGRFPLAGV